jgi:hypothetical protein
MKKSPAKLNAKFNYGEMTQRNIGFVTAAEQAKLRKSRLFVCGTGGMGGACLQALARAGVSSFEIADFDTFEVSNLNRQVFASLSDVGQEKVEVTRKKLLDINPEIQIKVHGADWIKNIDSILKRCKLVINGMDDIAAGIHLYRRAQKLKVTVIDAYTSPLPSVTYVRPEDPRPEERLRYPSRGVKWEKLTPDHINGSKLREIEYVMVHSSSAKAVDLDIAAEMIAGKRSRMSFAPMVITTGNLMAFAAVAHLLKRKPTADYRGYFFNPHEGSVERPITNLVVSTAKLVLVKAFLRRLMKNTTGNTTSISVGSSADA